MGNTWQAVFRALVWRPFWKGGLRSAFVILGVALGVAITAAINLANHSALAAFRESIDLVGGRTHVQIMPTAQALPETVLTRLGWLRRLGEVTPVIEGPVAIPGHPLTLQITGLDLLHADIPWTDEPPALRSDRPVVLHPAMAAKLGLRAGATLTVVANDRPVTVTVAGVLPTEGRTARWGEDLVLTDIAVAQDVLHRPGELDHIDVRLSDPDQAGAVLTALQTALPAAARAVTPEGRNAQVGRMLRAFQANLAALSYIALLVGAYLIYNTLSVSVVQRRTEIGTLRAIGVSAGMVFAAITAEAVLIGTVGSLVGLAGGLLLAKGAVGAVSQTVNSLFVSTGAASVHYDPWTLLLSGGVGFVLSIAAATVPAWEASRTPPAVAMRRGTWGTKQRSRIALMTVIGVVLLLGAYVAAQQPPIDDMPVFGFFAAMLIVVGASFLVPRLLAVLSRLGRSFGMALGFPARIATVNLGASVGRHAVAVASLMVGLAMILSVAIMIGSFRTTVETWVNQTLRADIYVRPAVHGGQADKALLSVDTMERIAHLPGVAAVGPYREFPIVLKERPAKIGGGYIRFIERVAPMHFLDPTQTIADVAPRLIGHDRVIVSETFANHFGMTTGDVVPVPTPHGTVAMPIEGVYYDYANEQGIVIMDRSTLLKHFGDPRLTSISIVLQSGADAARVKAALLTDPALRSSLAVTGSGELRQEAMRIFDDTFAITYALQTIAMTVALLGVVATLVTLVLERQGEIAVLRAIGVTRRQIAAMVVAESAGMGVAGTIVGTGAGFALALLLIRVINKQSFGWTIQWHSPWRHVLTSSLLVMLTALLAGIYPGWRATRTTVSEALRSE